MTPTNNDKFNGLPIVLANLGLLALIAAASIISVIRLVDHFGPATGDILSFAPPTADRPGVEAQIVATPDDRSDAEPCILDSRVMRRSGGSVVIEAMRFDPSPNYLVHWIGGPTSDGPTNCGVRVDLRLDRSSMMMLRIAAGD